MAGVSYMEKGIINKQKDLYRSIFYKEKEEYIAISPSSK